MALPATPSACLPVTPARSPAILPRSRRRSSPSPGSTIRRCSCCWAPTPCSTRPASSPASKARSAAGRSSAYRPGSTSFLLPLMGSSVEAGEGVTASGGDPFGAEPVLGPAFGRTRGATSTMEREESGALAAHLLDHCEHLAGAAHVSEVD